MIDIHFYDELEISNYHILDADLFYIKNPHSLLVVKKVTERPYNIRDVKEQTPELCTIAVSQNGYVLEFIKEQTAGMCFDAVRQSGINLFYAREQTLDLCLFAAEHSAQSILHFVRDPATYDKVAVYYEKQKQSIGSLV